ncbi:IS200/IS605 family accessory protein TnpB-related protein [Bacillus taeanensis]|uniref:Transposase n=1 Tax=Bacillus taeanensis TaxID=273032 RepID=A0A366XPZ0_9BACI|nr:IS200/IS605 family accessory protein TnpB-related protein [Bacillus taeanensis]RBW68430.1 hypothetical protein DS031_16570 [Bacillus taeanensis]
MALGSKDETFGNQTAAYDLENNLRLRIAHSFEDIFGKYLAFPNVVFPYGQAHLDQAKVVYKGFTKSGKEKRYFRAITYRFIKKEEHWYVYATVEIDIPEVTTTNLNGSIGIDFNAGFLSICEIDRFGNPLKEWTIKVPMYDRKSEQVKVSLGDAIKDIVEYAQKVGKPTVFEALDFTKKKQQLGEVSRKYARMLSGFGYSNFKEMLQSKSKREGVQTVPVNPAFTSQIGHMKFMGRYGLSSHGSAACMIARKGSKFRWEKPNYTTVLGLPKTFDKEKPNKSNWFSLSPYTKNKFYFNDKIELLKADC